MDKLWDDLGIPEFLKRARTDTRPSDVSADTRGPVLSVPDHSDDRQSIRENSWDPKCYEELPAHWREDPACERVFNEVIGDRLRKKRERFEEYKQAYTYDPVTKRRVRKK